MLALDVLLVVLQRCVGREQAGKPACDRGLAGCLVVGAQPLKMAGDESRERGAVLTRVLLRAFERRAFDADRELGLVHAVQTTTFLNGIMVGLCARHHGVRLGRW